ncbi:MAG: threonine/serine exporter family protein, partial [Phycisphaerae bacterium]|nr:threonine/serine exporter family protein [Gemmatimonadaceae bacterium]
MTVTAEYAAKGLPPVPPPTGTAHESASQFLLELARALHVHGTPANRLETALKSVAIRLGLEAQFFSTPTSLLVGIGPTVQQQVHLLRVEPGAPNLGHLSQLSTITRDVVDGTADPAEGSRRIATLLGSPQRWPTPLRLLAYVMSSSAIACFLKVNRVDVGIAALLGLVTGLIMLGIARRDSLSHVTEILVAFIVSTIAFTIDGLTSTQSGYATSLAGLAVLLPGLMLTIALTELSAQHLSSGTARLMGAIVIFLALAFGIALGARFGNAIGNVLSATFPSLDGGSSMAMLNVPGTSDLPSWAEWLALLIAPLAFTVLLNAESRDAGLIVVASALSYITARFAGAAVGEELGAFLGALVVSAGSNVSARLLKRSAMVTLTPGLLVLVPGSIGFRGITSMLGHDIELGVATAFRVALIGISLAAGVLAGNVVTESYE